MPKILKVNTPSDYSRYHGIIDRHPLVSIIDYSRISPIRHSLNSYGVYGIFLQDNNDNDLTYGCGKYDYRINEALHMNDDEHKTIASIFQKMEEEIKLPRDNFQDEILVSYISLLLKFCNRFYNRQFLTRKLANAGILSKFETLLHEYYAENRQGNFGIPTVNYCAEQLCMSPSYFSDLIKKTTGENASSTIRRFIVRQAKNGLASGLSVSEVAYRLGLEYPQHLSRLFKKETGHTPKQYLASLNKNM